MKQILTTLLILTWMVGAGQKILNTDLWTAEYLNVITDSIVWQTTDTLRKGDIRCKHKWVYSDEWRWGGAKGCLVLHHGFHCDWDDMCRNAICKKCRMKITQRQQWYQRKEVKPKSEYEKLDEDTLIETDPLWAPDTIGLQKGTIMAGISMITIKTDTLQYSDWDQFITDTIGSPKFYDTIPVIMLVCDTSYFHVLVRNYEPDSLQNDRVYWINGYQVLHKFGNTLLDNKKQPIKPEIVVWDSRRRHTNSIEP